MIHYLLLFILVNISPYIAYESNITKDTSKEVLILFTQKVPNTVTKNTISEIQQLANKENISLIIKDIKDGAPLEIKQTPTIVFQNYRGRSYYRGRYTNTKRIENFIRTARYIPQTPISYIKKDVLIKQIDRTTLVTPLKITSLTGSIPKGFNQEIFNQKAKIALGQSVKNFDYKSSVTLDRHARLFYFDFHPYRSADGQLYLSTKIFSMFNCEEPVYFSNTPIKGNFKKFKCVFKEAGKHLIQILEMHINTAVNGDAFTPVSNKIAVSTWDNLGLALPNPPKVTLPQNQQALVLPQQWTYHSPIADNAPVIQFHFQSPLDGYAGEVKNPTGQITLNENRTTEDIKGAFEVSVRNLTMGDIGLDYAIFNKILKVEDYPAATFKFKKAIHKKVKEIKPLTFGQVNNFQIEGVFELMKKQQTVLADAQISPVLKNNELLLHLTGRFEVNLKAFDIEGPDGPSPNKDTMVFYINLYLKAVE